MGHTKELLIEANELYGFEVVFECLLVVEVSDPDGAYSHFEDMGMYDHAECVEFLYFEKS